VLLEQRSRKVFRSGHGKYSATGDLASKPQYVLSAATRRLGPLLAGDELVAQPCRVSARQRVPPTRPCQALVAKRPAGVVRLALQRVAH
jgi:hypothetical protein